jgi:SAM-dependent methyltransferase
MNAPKNWTQHYGAKKRGLYPTEWVVRTLAGGNYPGLKIDKSKYAGARILDMGCGDGRNLGLLHDLGFEVHAVEISAEMIDSLRTATAPTEQETHFAVGRNDALPYADGYFDYMLCCASCYYLEGDMTWSSVRAELARVLKPKGLMVANFCDEENAVLKNAERHSDGSLIITSDPFNIRNGSRFMAAATMADLQPLLAPEFRLVGSGHQSDDYFGLQVSGFLTVSERI